MKIPTLFSSFATRLVATNETFRLRLQENLLFCLDILQKYKILLFALKEIRNAKQKIDRTCHPRWLGL